MLSVNGLREVFNFSRIYGYSRRRFMVLGIETSCDDTGLAIVRSDGKVLANVLSSQQKNHTRYGGIIPPVAENLHRKCIENNFKMCMDTAGIAPEQLEAIAVTTRPGLPMSLMLGLRFAKHLARKFNKPIVPVHHMEAHALQAGMEQPIPFPFLCLLISGGHCQLVFVQNPMSFSLIGQSLDDAPGELMDKVARRLRLPVLRKYRTANGGYAIEDAAAAAFMDPNMVLEDWPLPLCQLRNCNFSFSGLKEYTFGTIRKRERLQKTPPDGIIHDYSEVCANLLYACNRHLMNRTQRALDYCVVEELFGASELALVVSGGVANNDLIFANMQHLGKAYECSVHRPSKAFCSDNGVMIAWNAIQRMNYRRDACLVWDYDSIAVQHRSPYNGDLRDAVEAAGLKTRWVQPLGAHAKFSRSSEAVTSM